MYTIEQVIKLHNDYEAYKLAHKTAVEEFAYDPRTVEPRELVSFEEFISLCDYGRVELVFGITEY